MQMRHSLHLAVSIMGLGIVLGVAYLRIGHPEPHLRRQLLLGILVVLGLMALTASAFVMYTAVHALRTVRQAWPEVQQRKLEERRRLGR